MRTQLKAKLASISTVNSTVSGIYTPPLPESAPYPLITIQRTINQQITTLEGVTVAERDIWQIDAYAYGAGAWIIVDALVNAIRTALSGKGPETWSGLKVLSCIYDDGRDLPENQSVQGQEGIVRRSMDFIIKYKSA